VSKPQPHYALATQEDFAAILGLQNLNLLANLLPDARADGFLSVEFTEELLAEIVHDVAIVKATIGDELVGYRMAQTIDFNLRFPLLAAIIAEFPRLRFEGRPLSDFRTVISGPTCVARNWRGRGVYEGMFVTLCQVLKIRFEIGVTFIADTNLRSLGPVEKWSFSFIF